MADQIEYNLPLFEENKPVKVPGPQSAAVDGPPEIAQANLPRKSAQEEIPSRYTLDIYYHDDEIAKDVLRNKYLAPNEVSPWELWLRQARAIASVEPTAELRQTWEERYLGILEDFRFVPGGRIMHGAGREDIKSTLNNCYVMAIQDDSIQDIYQTLVDEAKTYKYGGGCGHDLSILRPAGDPIHGTGGESCGPTGFMELFSTNTNTIAQHGRRGANMQTLRVDHPDIHKFVAIKSKLDKVKYSNISVLLTHEFMQAVETGSSFDLRWGGQVYQTVQARDLWDEIIRAAHASAEPGLIFWDTVRDYHNGEYVSPVVSTNPCAEQPLPDGGCCNLGSINLERFVDEGGEFMMDPFRETVAVATRFLDDVIDYNLERHALPAQRENALNDRRVGLGLLGLGDMFVRMQITYDSPQALETVDLIMREMRNTAYATSIALAREKGPFPNFDWAGYSKSLFVKNLPQDIRADVQQDGIRNVTILTVPPTGSGAIVAQVTSGIEPIFATSYTRRVRQNEDDGETFREYTIYHPVIKNLFGSDQDLPDYVVTSHNIDPFFRVKMQGLIQRYIDSSISSTVNLPGDIDVDTVADIYMAAYREGLKGITVYREGSREGILITQQETVDQETGRGVEKTAPAGTGGNGASAGETEQAGEETRQNPATGPRLHPRARSEVTFGMTRRIRTGEGNLYVTINEDDKGLCEVFTTIGKAGGQAATQAEAISRLISLALRSGVDADEVVRQLRGISGPNPMWDNGRLILSTPDAISQVLADYLAKRPWSQGGSLGHGVRDVTAGASEPFMLAAAATRSAPAGAANGSPPAAEATATDTAAPDPTAQPAAGGEETAFKTMTTCPDCGGPVIHESGCVTCPGCGYSRC